jgi:hypothetical protein
MNEIERVEEKRNVFFSIRIGNIAYDLYLDSNQEGDELPQGQATVLGEDDEEISKFDVDVEDIVVNIAKFFGYKGKISKEGISYFILENSNGKKEMNFFGEFGVLKIDEKSNLEYETTPQY